MNTNTDAGKLELAVYEFINPSLSGICDFVKIGSRNNTINDDKMVYFNAPISFYDLDAIATTKMRIEIYVKDISGFKDTIGLSKIRDAIIPLLDGEKANEHYFIQYTDEISGSDKAGFHFIFLNINVTVV